jgi:hypothetical protein
MEEAGTSQTFEIHTRLHDVVKQLITSTVYVLYKSVTYDLGYLTELHVKDKGIFLYTHNDNSLPSL